MMNKMPNNRRKLSLMEKIQAQSHRNNNHLLKFKILIDNFKTICFTTEYSFYLILINSNHKKTNLHIYFLIKFKLKDIGAI